MDAAMSTPEQPKREPLLNDTELDSLCPYGTKQDSYGPWYEGAEDARAWYEGQITSGKLRAAEEAELWHPIVPEDEWRHWLSAPDPVFTMLVTKCCGRNPWTPPWLVGKETRNRYVCPGCGNPITR